MKNLAIISTYSDNQTIKHLPIKIVAGHPLMFYQVDCAKKVQDIHKYIVATNNTWYAHLAQSMDAEAMVIPTELLDSHSSIEDILLWVIGKLEINNERFDNVIYLPVTNPLNKPQYIEKGIQQIKSGLYKSVCTYIECKGIIFSSTEPQTIRNGTYWLETGSFGLTDIETLKQTKNMVSEPCCHIEIPRVARFEVTTFDDLLYMEAFLGREVRQQERKYFSSKSCHSHVNDYYQPKIDPDGKLRDLTQEKQQRINFAQDEIAFINSLIEDGIERRFLDIGCGPGYVSSAISDRYDKYGLEVSPIAADLAKNFIPTMHIGPLEEETYPEEYFDVVLCHHVIEHIDDPLIFVRLINKILKTHGNLIIGSPNFDSGAARRFGKKFRLLNDATHISLFSDFSLKQLLEDFGFIVDKIIYPFFETEYFTPDNLLRMFDTTQISPPFYGSIFTIFARKK